MNIIINTSNLKVGGGLQVADSFISFLWRYTENRFIVVLSDALLYLEDKVRKYPNCATVRYNIPQTIKGVLFGENAYLDSLVDEYHADIAFTVFGPALWRPKVKHICGFARPQIIYTESPFFANLSFSARIGYKLREKLKLFNFDKTSDILVSENEDVSKRLQLKLPNKKIYTVTNYYNQIFDNKQEWINDKMLPLFNGLTLLTISANYPHKNLGIIYKVIDYIEVRHIDLKLRFVLTLSEKQFPMEEKYRRYVYLVGNVNIAQCPHLYEQADIMYLPTLLECFSASYVEAMRMNVPILTSDLPFARALCGNAAEYCDSLSAQSIVNKIIELGNLRRRKELAFLGRQQLRTFDTAEMRANKYMQIIQNII